MNTSVVLTDSRGYRWVYTDSGLRLHKPSCRCSHHVPTIQAEPPKPWLTRLWTWLSEAPAHDRW